MSARTDSLRYVLGELAVERPRPGDSAGRRSVSFHAPAGACWGDDGARVQEAGS